MDKKELRSFIRNNPVEVDSAGICRRILEHPWFQSAKVIMAFVPLADEPQIQPVLRHILQLGKKLIVPKCESDGIMTARQIHGMFELRRQTYGILEPDEQACIADLWDSDLILVPGMAFDRDGTRLGRGKGYYDRFLSTNHAKTIGICSRLLDEVPAEAHDIRMDSLVTGSEIIYCKMVNEV